MAAVSPPGKLLSAMLGQTAVPPAQQPRAFSTAATFRLELRGYDAFETYSPPCHRNEGKINEILVGALTGESRPSVWRPAGTRTCCFHSRLCRTQEQSGITQIFNICSSLIDSLLLPQFSLVPPVA